MRSNARMKVNQKKLRNRLWRRLWRLASIKYVPRKQRSQRKVKVFPNTGRIRRLARQQRNFFHLSRVYESRREQQVSARSMNLILAPDIEFQGEKKNSLWSRRGLFSFEARVGRWNNKNFDSLSPLCRATIFPRTMMQLRHITSRYHHRRIQR